MLPKHKTLLEYLPPVLRPIEEFRQITNVQQPEVDGLREQAERQLDNAFILTARSDGVARWEKIVGITPKGTDTLEERRFVVLARFNEQLPFTYRMLRKQLDAICGEGTCSLSLQPGEYRLQVGLAGEERIVFLPEIQALLERVVPANILAVLSYTFPIAVLHNESRPRLHALRIRSGVAGAESRPEVSRVTIRGAVVQNTQTLQATLTQYTMWYLNGVIPLDGSRKLNAGTIREVL